MKKRILLVSLALIMCLSMVLTSCSFFQKEVQLEELNFSDVFKTVSVEDDYTYLSSYSTMNITGDVITSSAHFIVTTQQTSGGTSKTTYCVYDIGTEAIVKTFTVYSQSFTRYYFDLIDDEYFAVLKETYDEYSSDYNYYTYAFDTSLSYFSQYTVEIYNKAGTLVDSADASGWYYDFDDRYTEEFIDYLENDSYYYEGELFYEGNKLYKYENEEKVLIKEFGVEYMPDIDSLFEVGDYYCYFGESNYSYTIQLFNESLEPVANYAFPSYADIDSEFVSFFPLGNDKIYIQYTETLHQDAKDYDFRIGETGKYDLVTLILNVTDNTVTELEDVNYKVSGIVSTRMENADEDFLNDVVDNVAMVHYIDDNGHLDLSATNYKIVGMSNGGDITANINIAGTISSLPVPYSDNLFCAPSATDSNMYYIYNAEGEIVSYRSMDANIYGDYIYTEYGIYALNGNKVYDLNGKDFYIMDGGSSIIYTKGGEGTTYYLFHDGTLTTIGSIGMSYSMTYVDYSYDYFYTVKENNHADYSKTYTYTYYNAKGDTIGTFDSELTCVTETDDYVIMEYIDPENSTASYYKFSRGN